MKYLFSFFFILVCVTQIMAQKPPIDSSVYSKWPTIEGAAISNDGKYVLYNIRQGSIFLGGVVNLVLQSTSPNWKIEIPGASNVTFTQDSRWAIFMKSKDSLGILELGRSYIEYKAHVRSFKLQKNGTGEWLAYQLNTSDRKMIISNLVTKKEFVFAAMRNYLFSDDGKGLVLHTDTMQNDTLIQTLDWVSLVDGNKTRIWSTASDRKLQTIGNIVIDKKYPQLAFVVNEKINNQLFNSIWYYRTGLQGAVMLLPPSLPGVDTSLQLSYIRDFSLDGKRLLLSIKEKEYPLVRSDNVKLNIWSYTDATLQSYQLKNQASQRFTAVVNIDSPRIIQLEQKNEMLFFLEDNASNTALVSISRMAGAQIDASEIDWNTSYSKASYLINTRNGVRKRIKELEDENIRYRTLSPEGKYLVYFNGSKKNYFSYEIESGITRNLTQYISTQWSIFDEDGVGAESSCYQVAGWYKDDAFMLLYDQNDIWRVDPTGKLAPVNISNGYGRKHNIVFRLALLEYSYKPFNGNDEIILSAFDRVNKNNGFFKISENKKGAPYQLTMDSCFYYIPECKSLEDEFLNQPPIKARDAKTYLVSRMRANQSRNYFITTDFKKFTPLTDIYPEKRYNWFTTELHSWKTKDGNVLQGILYKPEDFDSQKKYPVIFNYYEKRSNGLNAFIIPKASYGSLNIPWYVSNGYLVFIPDIHQEPGKIGECALQSVVSAANYLSIKPYVDSNKLGLQGFSFGGFETNYLVTHTNLFTAACSASGIFDFVSHFGSLSDNGSSLQAFNKLGQLRMGADLWENPDLYIKNSVVFQSNKVYTPLLMFHTTNDGTCHFSNAVEFFTALRRQRKKVWMLEYEEGDHGVNGKSADDFSIRMAQFFDHYLKGVPPPKWMTQGVPASKKGIDNGLELDLSGRRP